VTTITFQVEIGNDADGWIPYGGRFTSAGTVAPWANEAEETYQHRPSIGVRVVRITETREVL
jgi:hypothetical protein